MHKQRSRRVPTKKAYNGSKRNKVLKNAKVHKSDWYQNRVITWVEGQDDPIISDAAQYSKPDHAKRAVSIETCFPKMPFGNHDSDTESLITNLMGKFGRKNSRVVAK